ncbi:MAG: peptidoglycan DD-metalloendopeptidase family protein [Anaerolineae bacterium]|nr:peptidoglycan DD-metalloendopeptidase family protein [Anaerolineae bacterium]
MSEAQSIPDEDDRRPPSDTTADLEAAEGDEEETGLDQGLWVRLAAFARDYFSGFTPMRWASHAAMILVAALVLIFSQVELPRWELPRLESPQPEATADESLPLISFWPRRGGSGLESSDSLMRMAVPFTIIPERPRLEIITHTVEAGDTLSGIASKYKLSLNTVMWASGLELCPQLLRVGQQLVILPVDGVHHVVEEGDTLSDIARLYKVEPKAIVGLEPNGLKDENSPLVPGQVLIIPGGKKEDIYVSASGYTGAVSEPSRVGTGQFSWPGRGRIMDIFGSTTIYGRPRSWPHKGIDIGIPLGGAVLAADSGVVSVVRTGGYNGGYGNYIVINHNNGFSTLYAHLSAVSVQQGTVVAKGQRIGSAGATGMAEGAHLHFEIRYNNVPRNPLCFLSAQ